jgi:hypothetical protein
MLLPHRQHTDVTRKRAAHSRHTALHPCMRTLSGNACVLSVGQCMCFMRCGSGAPSSAVAGVCG